MSSYGLVSPRNGCLNQSRSAGAEDGYTNCINLYLLPRAGNRKKKYGKENRSIQKKG